MKLLRRWIILLAVISVIVWSRAESFVVTLELQGAHGKQSVTNAIAASRTANKPRAKFKAQVNESLKVLYRIGHNSPTPIEDVLVHLYVAPEEQLNQMRPPNLKSELVILESALVMDFKTNHIAQGTFSFKVNRPGIFLVRVESLDSENTLLDESFAAIDLEIQ